MGKLKEEIEERRIAYEIKKEEERRQQLGFNESNPWTSEKEAKLKDELVDVYLIVYTDTATRLNIEFTNEHRIAVEKPIRSWINEDGYVETKEELGETKEELGEIKETEFREMITEMLEEGSDDDDDYQ